MKAAIDAVITAQGFIDRVQQYQVNKKVKLTKMSGKKKCLVKQMTTGDVFELTSINLS